MCVFYLLPNNNDVTANKYIITKFLIAFGEFLVGYFSPSESSPRDISCRTRGYGGDAVSESPAP